MFDHSHYVPILRWKQGEQRALLQLDAESKRFMTPLLEMPKLQVLKGRLSSRTADEIATNWGNGKVFFDVDPLVTTSGKAAAGVNIQPVFNRARELNIPIIPVTGLYRDERYQSSIRDIVGTHGRGICLRLMRGELDRPALAAEIDSLLSTFHLTPDMTDLVIDLKIFRPGDQDISRFLGTLPHVTSWRTLTLASGAFPKDLSGYRVGQHVLARKDWQSWRDQINGPLIRRPTYGDYTILHPFLMDPVPGMNISASIRYTSNEYWVIMRGEGLRNDGGMGHAQYPANAELLSLRSEFCGENFSAGDRYIYEIGTIKANTGNPTSWVQAGINHHLTFVVRQIANLRDS